MAKQVQLRRGTAAQNNQFTGAPGEVTVDTDLNTLRVHDGTTPGGTILATMDSVTTGTGSPSPTTDYVTEYQAPTSSNNYTWYRKYHSGWIEQGGQQTSASDGTFTITLPVAMSDKNYNFTAGVHIKNDVGSANMLLAVRVVHGTSSTSVIKGSITGIDSGWNGAGTWAFDWRVCGIAE